ncbi:MAG: 5-nucleotidase [Paenibacillus sp.]|nr:5-nucleotidase [Paenibacillus sp.]
MDNSFNRVKKWVGTMLAALMIVGTALSSAPVAQAATDNSKVVISQIYGGGGNSGATYRYDFIELYNPTNQSISLNDWSVQYTSASGTSYQVTKLTGSIDAKGYYLVQQAKGNGGTLDLPTPDAIGILALSGTAGKVALVSNFDPIDPTTGKNDADIVDFVGFGTTANQSETAPTTAPSNTTSVIRKEITSGSGDRGKDTDNNSQDFEAKIPSPRNSSYGQTVAKVTAQPAAGAVKSGTTVYLQTSTVSASVYYSVYDADGTAIIVDQLFTTGIPITEETTIKVYAQKNAMKSEIAEFHYTIVSHSDIASVRLMNVNSKALIEGIVTYKEYSGGQYNLYVQDSTAGIVVRVPSSSANIGDKISAVGLTFDFNGLAELTVVESDLQIIELNAGTPSPEVLDSRGFMEANEGKLIKVENVTLGTGNQFNEYSINDAHGSFMIKSSWVEAGKHYDQIIGVLTYSFGNYILLPRSFTDIIEENFSVIPSIRPGIVTLGTAVYLTSPTMGAKVYYTMDGTTPSASSTEFQSQTSITIHTDTTIKAITVNGLEISEVYTFEYITQKTYSGKKIHDIQSSSHESPIIGHKVAGVKGVVTHTETVKGTKRFYIQELAANYDSDVNTSEAILIISSFSVVDGEYVSVDGTVSEIKEDGYSDAKDLTTTALNNTFVTKNDTQQTAPAAVVVGVDRIQPSNVIDNDGMQTFDPTEDALDFYESLESMRVQLDNPTIVGPFNYEIPVVVGDQASEVLTPNGGLI